MSDDPGYEPSGLSNQAYACALASLPGVGASVARALEHHSPEAVWRSVLDGELDMGPARRQRRSMDQVARRSELAKLARRTEVAELWGRCVEAGIGVSWLGSPDFPKMLIGDPAPPAVLFYSGDLGSLNSPCVGLVGTRRPTPQGSLVAFELARDLVSSGICVVSGLAVGIDLGAHAGALEGEVEQPDVGTTCGIAASGVDVPYPRRNATLWAEVARRGLLLSESPPGSSPQAWRFPARNRLIAALSRMVVVVESHASGGSLYTVDAAVARGREVGAVPGPVRSSASAGTNQLLHDGAHVVREATDVLDVLGMSPGLGGGERKVESDLSMRSETKAQVLESLGWTPCTLDQIAERSGLRLAAVVVVLERLVEERVISSDGAWWWRKR